jgi:hypothetical protein
MTLTPWQPRWIDPKQSSGCLLRIDKSHYNDLASLLEPYLLGRYAYKEMHRCDATGIIEERAWIVHGAHWSLQLDARFSKQEGSFMVFILASKSADLEVQRIAQILVDAGAARVSPKTDKGKE